MDEQSLFRLLELNDALFPIGAYAHSFGLETYVQAGVVCNRQTAEQWLKTYFSTSFLYGELLAVRLAYEYASNSQIAQLVFLEEELVAAKSPREIREALQKLGKRLAKNAQKIGLPYAPIFTEYLNAVQDNISYPVCYGVLTAALNLPKRPTLLHYFYAQVSSLTNTCVKLIPLSQTDGAQLLADFYPVIASTMNKVFLASRDDLCRSAPGLDIRAMQHEDLYSRLYMS